MAQIHLILCMRGPYIASQTLKGFQIHSLSVDLMISRKKLDEYVIVLYMHDILDISLAFK